MDTKTQLTEVPLYIKVNRMDNVAIVVNTGAWIKEPFSLVGLN